MEKSVYLEDLQPPKKDALQDENQNPVEMKSAAVVATTSLKRQRTLVDMFAGASQSSSDSSSKKVKLTATATRSSSNLSSAKSTESTNGNQSFGLKKLNSIPFSQSGYVDSLSEEQRPLLELECEVLGKSWLKVLKDEIKRPYFISLKKFLWNEGVRGPNEDYSRLKIYPHPRNIYAWSNTPLGKVKVVILGQDPYHGPGQAHGLCFSVPMGVAVPPSLRNIYAELRAEYPGFEPPKHGNLSAWAGDGVLMLNTCLTVRAGEAGSHSNKGWEQFTDRVIDVVDKYGGANLGSESAGFSRGVVFLAWGAWAAKRVEKVNKTKHLILKSAHPSPLSANRGFLGNGHFKAANDWLEQRYGPEGKVNWCDLDIKE